MALTLYYLVESFYSILPWSWCMSEWTEYCLDSSGKIFKDGIIVRNSSGDAGGIDGSGINETILSSSELHFM